MHPYTKHLLEDISKAYRPRNFFNEKKSASGNLPEAELSELHSFMDYERNPPFSTFCGLTFEDFPPEEKFETEDLRELTQALIKMFETWNIIVVLPENLPTEMGYRITLNLINNPMPVLKFGFFFMDYCTCDPVGCEFEDYCPCLKQAEQ
jgi:hypothetical protein